VLKPESGPSEGVLRVVSGLRLHARKRTFAGCTPSTLPDVSYGWKRAGDFQTGTSS
jgi:hypothetical protein